MSETTKTTVTFTIGGVPYEIPMLNLKAQRVALRRGDDLAGAAPLEDGQMPTAEQRDGVDRQYDAMLECFCARALSIDAKLTPDFIETNLAGQAEIAGFMASMFELLEISGFLPQTTAPAP